MSCVSLTDALFCHSSSSWMPTHPLHAPLPDIHTSCPEVTQGHGGDSRVASAWNKCCPIHSKYYYGCFTEHQLIFSLHNSQLRTGVKALLSGYCSQRRGENEREMPSCCQPASLFKPASVELIKAPEIKMRGWSERLLEIRNLLAVNTAV